MNLAGFLMVLAAEGASPSERNRAAARVHENITTWIGGFLRGKGFALDEDDKDDIVQHVLFRASTGTARFRGESEGEAHAWCRKVAYNKAVDIVNMKKREIVEAPADSSRPQSIERTAGDLGEESGAVRGEAERVRELVARIEDTIRRTSRKNDTPSLILSFRCHVDARLGDSIEAQIEKYGFGEGFAGEPRDHDGVLRARNRVYQWRKRGREAGCKALGALRSGGLDDDAGLGLMARFLGCKDHETAPRAKKELAS